MGFPVGGRTLGARWLRSGGPMTDDDVSEAADDAVDDDRSLAGEDPTTQRLEDAELWTAVYSELAAFKKDLVASTEVRAATMLVAGARELRDTDLPILRAEADRLNRRLELWRRRRDELSDEAGRRTR